MKGNVGEERRVQQAARRTDVRLLLEDVLYCPFPCLCPLLLRHPADDQLRGTAEYGENDADPLVHDGKVKCFAVELFDHCSIRHQQVSWTHSMSLARNTPGAPGGPRQVMLVQSTG